MNTELKEAMEAKPGYLSRILWENEFFHEPWKDTDEPFMPARHHATLKAEVERLTKEGSDQRDEIERLRWEISDLSRTRCGKKRNIDRAKIDALTKRVRVLEVAGAKLADVYARRQTVRERDKGHLADEIALFNYPTHTEGGEND